MGYKKLDEVMELLNDELNEFNKAIDRLEHLTKNTDNIKIQPDTSKIENMLQEHLDSEKAKNKRIQETLRNIGEQISKARMVPKVQLWLQYSIWIISLVIIGYMAFRVSRIETIQEKAFAKGEQQVISSLRGYFDENPEHYQSYRKWIKEKDSVNNKK
jgi:hypothetical protein